MPSAGFLAVAALVVIGYVYVVHPVVHAVKHSACVLKHGRKACKGKR